MDTYTQEDFESIAAAVDKDIADVTKHRTYFENAALMFRLDGGSSSDRERSRSATPTKLRHKLERIENSARRLLKALGVARDDRGLVKIEEAYDGPGDAETLKLLSWAIEHDESTVVMATRRVGRLAEILEAVEAAADIEQWARRGSREVIKFGRLTVPKGHRGDGAVSGWIAAMLSLYKKITGKQPGTSVGSPETDEEGIAGGPLIRFMEAAGKPLGIEYSPDAWRSRIRGILDHRQN